jgi:hypothetical protein
MEFCKKIERKFEFDLKNAATKTKDLNNITVNLVKHKKTVIWRAGAVGQLGGIHS